MSAAFQLIAEHPALDLVNTLDWRFGTREPQELLASYRDLLRFTEQSGVLTHKQAKRLRDVADERALKRCIELREAIAEICYARLDGRSPSEASLGKLEQSCYAARLQQQFRWKDGRLAWRWKEKGAELPVWALSLRAADLLLSESFDRVRACDNPECRWLFLDTSKNHSKRWCDMKVCGNRMKARRFKAQHKDRKDDLPLDALAQP